MKERGQSAEIGGTGGDCDRGGGGSHHRDSEKALDLGVVSAGRGGGQEGVREGARASGAMSVKGTKWSSGEEPPGTAKLMTEALSVYQTSLEQRRRFFELALESNFLLRGAVGGEVHIFSFMRPSLPLL